MQLRSGSDVIIAGAGVFGTWTARCLQTLGFRVTLVDAYGPGNSRSSSGDESRIIRCGYGPDEIYSEFARRSLDRWRDLSARLSDAAHPLLHQCGVLWLGGDDPYTHATRATLERGGYPVEVLDAAGVRSRYPQLRSENVSIALLEPACGVLMARSAVQALAADVERMGARVLRSRIEVGITSGPLRAVRLEDGTELAGDAFVFACGAWLPKVFPDLLAGRIRPTRQVVIYFGPRAGDERFGPRQMPAWVDFSAGMYGVPDLEGRGLKVGIDAHGPDFDPDRDDRVLDSESVAQARTWLSRRLPSMADAPILESRICQYENTSTGDFLIDRHPAYENVWIVGGGSGHGFKHGPAVGEYVARLMTAGGEAEPRFLLQTKTTQAHRVVY